jgi:hypothetical protein
MNHIILGINLGYALSLPLILLLEHFRDQRR